ANDSPTTTVCEPGRMTTDSASDPTPTYRSLGWWLVTSPSQSVTFPGPASNTAASPAPRRNSSTLNVSHGGENSTCTTSSTLRPSTACTWSCTTVPSSRRTTSRAPVTSVS